MAQGSLKLTRPASKGGRNNNKHSSRMKKGSRSLAFNDYPAKAQPCALSRKPKKQNLAAMHNKSKKMTAAIARNIERETGKRLSQNGGDLSTLKRVAAAAKGGGDETSKIAKAPKFDTRKQFKLTS